MEVITSETGITVSLVVVAISGVVWLTKLHSMASANREKIKALVDRMEIVEQGNSAIALRMERIETKLDFIIENLKK